MNLTNRNPHIFRHGSTVYNIQQAKNISDQKAISINLMHSDSEITDAIYSIQNNIELRNRIKGMTDKKEGNEIIGRLEKILKDIKMSS